jgi:hypothetical protein
MEHVANRAPKRRLTINELYGVVSHKTKFFILTAMRTSNAKYPTTNFDLYWSSTGDTISGT